MSIADEGRGRGGGGGGGRGDVDRRPVVASSSAATLRHTFTLMSQLMSQMQDATLTIERKTERTDEAVRALAECVKVQNQRLRSLEFRLQSVEVKLDAEDAGEDGGRALEEAAPAQVETDGQMVTTSVQVTLDSESFNKETQVALMRHDSPDRALEPPEAEPAVNTIEARSILKTKVSFPTFAPVGTETPSPASRSVSPSPTELSTATTTLCAIPSSAVTTPSSPSCPPTPPTSPSSPVTTGMSDTRLSMLSSAPVTPADSTALGKVLLHVAKDAPPASTDGGGTTPASGISSCSSSGEHGPTASPPVIKCSPKRSRTPRREISPIKKKSKADLEDRVKKQRNHSDLSFHASTTSVSSAVRPIPSHHNNTEPKSRPGSCAAGTQTNEEAAKERELLGRKLLKAAQKGRAKEVKTLLKEGADANYHNSWKWTALHWAAMKAHTGVVALLLNSGADVNARTSLGNIALHMAAYNDRKGRCADMLIEAGSYVDIWNQFGRTPLHLGAECGNAAVVKALVAAGATKSAKDAEGRTPFHVAKTNSVRRFLLL